MQGFQAGGTVREGSTYIERKADRELVEALLEGEFCYVLAPRQIGKSSLRMRAQNNLREQGVRCASVDLTSIGASEVTDDEWYFGLVEEIAGQLALEGDPATFWTEHESLSPVHRFTHFLRDEVLARVEEPVVISIDEIDAVLALPFGSDDFFAAIRAAYNARAEDPAYERLAFCIFGVATPAELIEDATRTPFNIGRGIRLSDFTRAEARALLPGLAGAGAEPRALLDAVLDWTSGHPYMTQRLCLSLTREPVPEGASPESHVDALVTRLFLERGRTEEPNLAYADKRIQKAEPQRRTQMLRVYRRLLHGDEVSMKGDDPAELELRLAGLVGEQAGAKGGPRLLIRNKVVAHVFDLRWVDENDASNPLAEPVASWLQYKRSDDFLLRGVAFEAALSWAKGRENLSPEEHEFLRMSSLFGERERSIWQRRRLGIALLAVALIAGCLGMVVIMNRREIDTEKRYVEQVQAAQKDAEARFAAAQDDLNVRLKQAQDAQKEAERKAQDASDLAATLQANADELERQLTAMAAQGRIDATAQKQVEDAKKAANDAYVQAVNERLAAAVVQDLTASAAVASPDAGSVVEKTQQSEKKARQIAETLLKVEQSRRQQAEKDLKDAREQLDACQKSARPPPPPGGRRP